MPTVAGPARLGRRTKELTKRLRPGEIAVIDHADLDRVSGEELVAARVAAVLNCRASTSGRYPNMGPTLIVEAGIPLVDLANDGLFERLKDGQPVEVHEGGAIASRGDVIAQGTHRTPQDLRASLDRARSEIGQALDAFARNTVEHLVEERELLATGIAAPPLRTSFRDRPALVVVRGAGVRKDLRALKPYIRDVRPVLVAVDGGAEALLEEGFRPDVIVGDMDSTTEPTLRRGAELVVHAYPDGRAPGAVRLDDLGLDYVTVPAIGTSQDVAMLIADQRGASLIVSVGSQFNLVEFLDKDRQGMSSTFLTRLRIGEKLVDAKGVSRLYRPAPGPGPLLAVLAAGAVALLAVVYFTPALRETADLLWLKLQVLVGIDA